jgi:hypothetical protein
MGSLLWLGSCDEQFDINAPYQDIWVVYGILNLEAPYQYVRVSKAFQVEGNAEEYAQNANLTVPGLRLQLQGADQQYEAVQIDSLRRDANGDFGPEMTLYRFETQGNQALVAGELYTLRITSDSLPGFFLEASTRVPDAPRIITPRPYGTFSQVFLPTVRFEDSVEVIFRKINNIQVKSEAMAFETRVVFEYEAQGEQKEAVFGPSLPFNRSRGCPSGQSRMLCYLWQKGVVLNSFQTLLSDPSLNYTYRSEPSTAAAPAFLSQALRIEVTAMDTVLGTYLKVNDIRQRDFTTVRPEFTNLTGTERAVGIFGSIAVDVVPVGLSPCGEYLLGLNGISDPSLCN